MHCWFYWVCSSSEGQASVQLNDRIFEAQLVNLLVTSFKVFNKSQTPHTPYTMHWKASVYFIWELGDAPAWAPPLMVPLPHLNQGPFPPLIKLQTPHNTLYNALKSLLLFYWGLGDAPTWAPPRAPWWYPGHIPWNKSKTLPINQWVILKPLNGVWRC